MTLAERFDALPRAGRWGLRAALLVLIVLGMARYVKYDIRNVTQVGDWYDLTFYYLNSKYFPELGYTGLYESMLVADAENGGRLRHVKRYRELESYRVVDVRTALSRGDAIRARFSEARWEAFKHDVSHFTARRLSWKYLFNDHGYNPPPTWTVVGRLLSTNVPLSHAKWITSVDFLLVAAMFAGIGWAFGELPLLGALLFFFWTGSSLWPLVGQALLRFDWLASAALGLAMVHRGRFLLSGALFAYAAWMRVFPAILTWPFVVIVASCLIKHARVDGRYLRMLAGGLATSAVLVGFAMLDLGPTAFYDGFRKILLHGGPDSYSSMRVGLGDLLVFHGETTRAAMNLHGGTLGKGELIRGMQPVLVFVGCLALLLIALVTLRLERERPWAVAALGVIPLYCVTTPNITYFNIRLLLVVSLIALERRRVRAVGGLVLLSLTEGLTYHGEHVGLRYYATSLTSLGLALTFGFLGVSYLVDLLVISRRALPWAARLPQPIRGGLLAAVLALPTVPCALVQRDVEPAAVPARRLSRVRPPHTPWNAPGTLRLRTPIAVQLPGPTHAPRVDVSLDANDEYVLRFMRGARLLGSHTVRPLERAYRGLRAERITVPRAAVSAGYDTVAVFPRAGDGRFAVGHLIPLE